MEGMMEQEKTISTLLLEAGYRHERTKFSATNGRHRIFEIATGKEVGLMSAHEAVEFLHTGAVPA
jgi:hypothetical protein